MRQMELKQPFDDAFIIVLFKMKSISLGRILEKFITISFLFMENGWKMLQGKYISFYLRICLKSLILM